MTPERIAEIHAASFADAPRPWSAAEFAQVLAGPGSFLVHRAHGFAVGRVAGPEAELLTLAVAPDARRGGLGRALMEMFEREAGARGAAVCFLEVAETNTAARHLYARCGYTEAGVRPGYYTTADGPVSAIVMRRSLVPRD